MIKITNPAECCGCTACASICSKEAITMVENEKGFFYPLIDSQKCIACGLCVSVCPLKKRKVIHATKSNIKASFAMRIKNKSILSQSSSGGAFSLLAKYVIEQNGIVCGASYDENLIVRHTFSDNVSDCRKFRGSKYSQSDVRGVFLEIKKYLNSGRIVLFTGTPCQCDGLVTYLRKPYDNLITADVICHSIPSPKYFKQYLSMVEHKYQKKLREVLMRDKSKGWGVDSYKYIFNDGSSKLNPTNIKCWQQIFESGLITRESCFDCQYTNLIRATDFTIGDFWDFDNKRPEIKSKEGTSVILLNTNKAIHIFDEVKEQTEFWSICEEEFMQPRLRTSSARPFDYDLFWELYLQNGFDYSYSDNFKPKSKIYGIVSIIKRKILKLIK